MYGAAHYSYKKGQYFWENGTGNHMYRTTTSISIGAAINSSNSVKTNVCAELDGRCMKKDLLWSGGVNSATTVYGDFSGYKYYLIGYSTNGGIITDGFIAHYDSNVALNLISVEPAYALTIYSRGIVIQSDRFVTGTGYYYRGGATYTGDFCSINEIYGLIEE